MEEFGNFMEFRELVERNVPKRTGNDRTERRGRRKDRHTSGRREAEKKDSIRTFICIEIPDSIKRRMEELENELRRVDAQVSWVKPSNVHLTLKFLGGVPRDTMDAVSAAAKRAARAIATFEVEVGGTGCFPSSRSPRVVWVGLTTVPEELIRLYGNLEEELGSLGFEREHRRFAPHLTIGRLRSPHNGAELAEKLIGTGFQAERFLAREVIVMRSEPKPTGSIYTPISIIPLRSGS